MFFLIALLGPLLGALVAAAAGRPWWWGAAPFVLFLGIGGLIHNWFFVDQPEDRVFHVVLTLVMLGLGALGGVIGRPISRRRTAAH
jgi:apolipoprotein N-acyltransferase